MLLHGTTRVQLIQPSNQLKFAESIVRRLLNCRINNLRSSMLLGCFPTFVVGSLPSRMHPIAPKAVCARVLGIG